MLYRQWHQLMSERYEAMVEQQKYVEDEERQREIDEQKRAEFVEELRQERMRSVAEKYALFATHSEVALEDESRLDMARLKSVIEEDLGVVVELSGIDPDGLSAMEAVQRAVERSAVEVPYEEQALEQLMAEFQAQQRSVDRDLELWNPGPFSLEWLQDEGPSEMAEYRLQFVAEDEKKLQLQTEVDRLYLVKWKNLSYLEATWEKESNIACPAKLMEFRQFNRSLDKDTRSLMLQQNQRHKVLLE